MSATKQMCYTFIPASSTSEPPNEVLLKEWLEKGDTKTKIYALKQVIHLILNGEKLPTILITIIRFVLPLEDHTIKKLLLIFWEIVPKTDANGKLLQEMVLVCDAFRKDLVHSNEYICGSTLRFLSKLKEPELLEPLIPSILKNLEHRCSYVAKNAVLAIFAIHKNFDYLVPDAPELITNFLKTTVHLSCRRNAFIMLMHVDQNRAVDYLKVSVNQVHTLDSHMQLAIVELVCKVCSTSQVRESSFIHCVYNLLNSDCPAVRYEAAGALVVLSNTPTAVKAAASCYIDLIVKGNDNSVKLIILDRLIALKGICPHVLQDLVMDILQILPSADLEVRRKALKLAQDLVSSGNVQDVVSALKKEIVKTHIAECEDTGKYRQLLVCALRSSSIKFPDTAQTIIPVLLEFLSDDDEKGASDIMAFIQEALQRFEHLRDLTLYELLKVFSSIKSSEIHRRALWILGEYCCTVEDIHVVMTELRQCIGNVPIVGKNQEIAVEKTDIVTPVIITDGTYATQSAFTTDTIPLASKKRPPLLSYLMDGDYFIATTLSSTLVKLALKYARLVVDLKKKNSFIAESMLIMTSIIHLGKSELTSKNINDDDLERVALCLKVLANQCPLAAKIFDEECRKSVSAMLNAKQAGQTGIPMAREKANLVSHVDHPITFGQLACSNASVNEDMFEQSLCQATGMVDAETEMDSDLTRLTQLTGFSDPIYAEAYAHLNHDYVVLSVLIVNQTEDTLQNCSLEFSSSDSSEPLERHPPFILAPHDFCNVEVSMKLRSFAGSRQIFGNISYNVNTLANEKLIVLNNIDIDTLHSILPATCSEQQFYSQWKNSKWEYKVTVNTHLQKLDEYLMFAITTTNMWCLTPEKLLGECDFLAANLYALTSSGECVAANVCIERNPLMPESPVTGSVRFRADSKNLAIGLGQKLLTAQSITKLKIGG